MERAVRILYVINALEVGGTEGQLVDLISGLNKSKVSPHLCCLREAERESHYKVDCPVITLGVKQLSPVRSLLELIRITRYINRERIDIVQTFFIEGTLFGVIAGKLSRSTSTVIVSKRDLGFMVTRSVLRRLKFVYRFADRFIANSESVKEYLATNEGVDRTTIDVIYNGIDLEAHERRSHAIPEGEIKRSEKIPETATIVGICANLNREVKRVDLFLEAAARICRHRKDVFLLIIGEGRLKAELSNLANKLGVGARTRFMGSQVNPAPFIRMFTVGINSSDSEGFSNSIMEYMSCGVPVVATRVGGNHELVVDGVNGLLVPPGDPDAMSKAILAFLDQPGLRIRVIRGAKRILQERFSSTTMIRAHEAFYLSLIESMRSRTKGVDGIS